MKLSIITPVFNEENTIKKIIVKVMAVKLPRKLTKEIIVVDDNSTDGSFDILKEIKGIKLLRHKKNMGKGAAIRTGIQKSTGDVIIIQDADLEYDPKYIKNLVKPVLEKKAEVVYGTRINRLPNLNGEERTFRFLLHYLGNRILSLLVSVLYGQWLTDMETGYKLFPKTALRNVKLNARGFELEPEITAKLLKSNHKILEIPIIANPRTYDEGKKFNTISDGFKALWSIVRYRFTD